MQQTTQISRAIKQSTIEERIAAQRPLDPSQLTNRLYSKSGRDNTQQLLIQQPRQGVPKAKKQPLQTIPTSTPVIPQLNLQQAAKRTTQTRTRYTPTQSSRDPSSHQTIQFLNPPLTTGRDATTNRATDPISENVLPNTHLPPLDSNSIKPLSSGADNAQTGRSGSGRRTNRPRSTGRTARELVTSRDYQQSSADIGKEPGSNVLIFIQSLRETGNTLDFVYARPACGQYDSLNPYDLIVVPYEKINKTDYYTVSTKGITHFFHGVVDFTSLEEWEKERKYYNLLLLIPTFKDYRVWRSFAAWESYVRCRRISAAHSILQTTHYLSEPPLQSAMNAVRKECLAFKDQIRLYVVNNQKTYSIDDFLLEREAQSNNFKIQLAEFSNSVVERVAKACHDVMDQKGFLKHESGSNKNATKALTSRRIEKKEGEGTDLDEALAGEMSYTKMAARRQECIRLTNFIRSVDCLLLDVLHHIVLQATYDLHHSLKRNLVNPAPTPPSTEAMDKLRNMIQKKRADDEEERLKEEIVRQKLEEEKRMAEDLKNPKKSKSAALNAGFQMRKNMSRSTLHPQTKSQKTVVIEDTIPEQDILPTSKTTKSARTPQNRNPTPPSGIRPTQQRPSKKEKEKKDREREEEMERETRKEDPFIIPYFSAFAAYPAQEQPGVPREDGGLIPLLQTNLIVQIEESGRNDNIYSAALSLAFSPSGEEMEQCMLDQVTQFLLDACTLNRLILSPRFKTYTSTAFSESGSSNQQPESTTHLMDQRCQDDKLFVSLRQGIRQIVEDTYQESIRFVTHFVPFVNILKGNVTGDDIEIIRNYAKSNADQEAKAKQVTTHIEIVKKTVVNEIGEETEVEEEVEVEEHVDVHKILEEEARREKMWTRCREDLVVAVKSPNADKDVADLLPYFRFNPDGLQYIPTPIWFGDQYDRYTSQLNDFNHIDRTFVIGPFEINTDSFKESLVPPINQSISELNTFLPQLAGTLRAVLFNDIRETQQVLSQKPESVEDFAEVLEHLTDAQNKQDQMQFQYETITTLYGLMRQYNLEINSEDQANNQLFEKAYSQLRTLINQTETTKEEQTNHFSNELQKRVKDLHKDITKLRSDITDPSLLQMPQDADETGYEQMRVSSVKLQTRVQKIQDTVATNATYQTLFNVKEDKYEDLTQAKQEIDLRVLLWKSIKEWSELSNKWRNDPIMTLNPDDMTATTARYQKINNRLERELPPNVVVPKAKNMIVEMSMSFPLVYALRNKDLKTHHWVKIKTALGLEQDANENDFTLDYLISIGAIDKRTELSQISDEASSEAVLIDLLHEIVENWSNLELHTKSFRTDSYLLIEVDDLMRELDDSQVQLQTIQGSRHVGPIKEQVDFWVSRLASFSEILDLWLLFQQKWLSLEVVFQSDELLKDYAKKFQECNRFWHDFMKNVHEFPSALRATQQPGLASVFRQHNTTMDEIQVALEGLLNTKRAAFGRFFFLPNDDLLEILKEGKNPVNVMPYMNKLFDNIKTLEFSHQTDIRKMELISMVSSEGEVIPFGEEKVVPRGKAVEVWMKAIETSMVNILRQLLAKAIANYGNMTRPQWILATNAQHVLAGSQIMWTAQVEQALVAEKPIEELKKMMTRCEKQLEELTEVVRSNLTPLQRTSVGALIVVDVHARDIVEELIRDDVTSVSNFDWQKRLRYYWDVPQGKEGKGQNLLVASSSKAVKGKKTKTKTEIDSSAIAAGDCIVRQTTSSFTYGYEYLGCTPRLVITPLTDQCYITLTSALHLKMGGAPAGPAGTGKTETTKDLGKAVARQCIVFNCSDGLNVDTMEQMFSGMCQAGAWFCFDEFNRIEIEVLSVVAQQIREIQDAQQANATRFKFQGKEIPLNTNCAVFITMNPGYAGRTELPDNLKALFRPVSMMIPDYALIAEIMLYSEGFKTAKPLSIKMVQLYKLSSEQLSQQRHYDFGMRAVKSVLVMAGQLRRDNPHLSEEIILIRAMKESNLPKFLADDVPLFEDIVGDLFPEVTIPENDYGELMTTLHSVCQERHLQLLPNQLHKTIELFDTFGVRHGVMLVGPTRGGKTVIRDILAASMTKLREEINSTDQRFQVIQQKEMNPKAISIDEMFGCFSDLTQEWKEGLLSFFVSEIVKDDTPMKKWIIFDGPVDTLWVESLNTVLDDSKTLCLPNRKRIKLTNTVSLLFEVENLDVASPATVSRCGMVYVDPVTFPWRAPVRSWVDALNPTIFNQERKAMLFKMFDLFMDPLLEASQDLRENIRQPTLSKVANVMKIMESYFTPENGFIPIYFSENDETEEDDERTRRAKMIMQMTGEEEKGPKPIKDNTVFEGWLRTLFFFGCVWGIGGSIHESAIEPFDTAIRKVIEGVFLPSIESVFDVVPDSETHKLTTWEVPEYKYESGTPFFNILVPTIDTVRYSYVADRLIDVNQPVLFGGETGVGKSVIVTDLFARTGEEKSRQPVIINFSAQTSSNRTQSMIESKLLNRRDHFAAVPGTTVVLFFDDFNMPSPDTFGSQPPLELIRQMLGTGGWYDRTVLQFRAIKGVATTAACGPPGGGRNKVSERLTALFTQLCIPQPSEKSLNTIFNSILLGHFNSLPFEAAVKDLAPPIVRASIELYRFALRELRPTPAKCHYLFNLRDLSKIVQGIMQVEPAFVTEEDVLGRLWAHESLRIFADRLTNDTDRRMLTREMCSLAKLHLRLNWNNEELFEKGYTLEDGTIKEYGLPMWSDLVTMNADEKPYQEVKQIPKLTQDLVNALQDYNLECLTKKTKEMDLVFFPDAVEHICRITRIIKQPRGNALLIGVGGCGKQSLTRLGAFIEGYNCFEIQLAKNYGTNEFREDLRRLYEIAGVENNPVVFLLSDAQIVQESFLEDINGILSSGEVPNLYDPQQREQVIMRIRQTSKPDDKVPEAPDAVMAFMTQRVRTNLHIVLCMSPVGDTIRRRFRMFPSLVNCCTIDWVANWPQTALKSVAVKLIQESPLIGGDDKLALQLSDLAVRIHASVEEAAERFERDMKRKTYVTPTLFLEMITLMFKFLKDRIDSLDEIIAKYSNGINTLNETQKSVAEMQEELKKLEPILIKQGEDLKELMEKIMIDQAKTNEIRSNVTVEEAFVREEADKAKALADDAQGELDKIMPVFVEANKALESLSKAAVTEVKSFANPPELVKRVMNAVCTLFNKKPDWDNARQLLSQTNFIQMLINFNVDDIDASMDKKMRPYIDDPEFKPDKVDAVSKAGANICQWVVAIVEFARVSKIIEPKKKAAAEAQAQLKELQDKLALKQKELADVEAALAQLNATFEAKKAENAKTEADIAQTQKRFQNATRLVAALGDEGERWKTSLADAEKAKKIVLGDSVLSAASLAYLGPFVASYRRSLIKNWGKWCVELEVPLGGQFQIEKVLASAMEIRDWGIQGLPDDPLSIENAVYVTRTRRWPLMIDPQGQANRWIREKERQNNLRVLRPGENNFMRTLTNAVRLGQPVLLEDVGETLDPQLAPLLLQQTVKLGGRMIIRLANQDVDYNNNFKLYITTKLANPHYLPDVCIKVTVINFTVTSNGLEDQLLADVVKNEKAELEEAKDKLVRGMAADKKLLADTEARILALLKGTTVQQLLDDLSLIDTLDQSKKTSTEIMERVKESEVTERELDAARNEYLPMAVRGAVLYFAVVDFAMQDPMYQYSLQYFKTIFGLSLTQTEQKPTLQERLSALIDNLTELIYTNICRGLFERHRLLFSFVMATQIKKKDGTITPKEWDTFVRLPSIALQAVEVKDDLLSKAPKRYPVHPPKEGDDYPFESVIDRRCWNEICCLDERWPDLFGGITAEMTASEEAVKEWTEYLQQPAPSSVPSPSSKINALPLFSKVMFVKTLVPQSFSLCAMEYVRETLGPVFVSSPPFDLDKAHRDSAKAIPIIFILSTGADPTQSVQRFAQSKGFDQKIQLLSLGQGQGPIASKMLSEATKKGHWVFLQNCHLAASWMPELERICLNYQTAEGAPAHNDFRLWLSAMPTSDFPIAVLQNGIKLTNEPPKGVRNNVLRSLRSIPPSVYEQSCPGKNYAFRRILFGLSFFHSLIQERRKYGALGWNIVYEFSDSDFEVSWHHLEMYLNLSSEEGGKKREKSNIPWKALRYMTGIVNYGGRVTDVWDKRTLAAILNRYYVDEITSKDPFNFGPTTGPTASAYVLGDLKTQSEAISFADSFPETEDPVVFGMHDNAELALQLAETSRMISAIQQMQPRVTPQTDEKKTEEKEEEKEEEKTEEAKQADAKPADAKPAKPKKEAPKEEEEEEEAPQLTGPDKEVLDMAHHILDTLPPPLERAEAVDGVLPALITAAMAQSHAELEPVQETKTTPSSLSIVLSQEMQRFNNLLNVITSSLLELERAIAGLVVMSQSIEDVYKAILFGKVPEEWENAAYPSLKPLGAWVDDLAQRILFFREWLTTGVPSCFWFSGFFFPQGFLTAVLQTYARKYKYPIDSLQFKYNVLKETKDQIKASPSDGVYVHGLFLEAARWDETEMKLAESRPGEMFAPLPVLHFLPQKNYTPSASLYAAPLYKTGARYGVLSTTGHSTNFVTAVTLPTSEDPEHWVLRGTALLCQQND